MGVAVDASGNVYVADTSNSTIRLLASGSLSTFAGICRAFGQRGRDRHRRAVRLPHRCDLRPLLRQPGGGRPGQRHRPDHPGHRRHAAHHRRQHRHPGRAAPQPGDEQRHRRLRDLQQPQRPGRGHRRQRLRGGLLEQRHPAHHPGRERDHPGRHRRLGERRQQPRPGHLQLPQRRGGGQQSGQFRHLRQRLRDGREQLHHPQDRRVGGRSPSPPWPEPRAPPEVPTPRRRSSTIPWAWRWTAPATSTWRTPTTAPSAR